MGKYISRKYLREKYKKIKFDMEGILDVLNEDAEDKISEEDAKRVIYNIEENFKSIINELK